MAAVDLCTFNHGLGIYFRILSFANAREKIIEYKCPTHEHKSTAAMNYFLIIHLYGINLFLSYIQDSWLYTL